MNVSVEKDSAQYSLLGPVFCDELSHMIDALTSGKNPVHTFDRGTMQLDSKPLSKDMQETLAEIAGKIGNMALPMDVDEQSAFSAAITAMTAALNPRLYDGYAKTTPLEAALKGTGTQTTNQKPATLQLNENAIAALVAVERLRVAASPILLTDAILKRERTNVLKVAQDRPQAINAIVARYPDGPAAPRMIELCLSLPSDSTLQNQFAQVDALNAAVNAQEAPNATELAALLTATPAEAALSARLFAAQTDQETVAKTREMLEELKKTFVQPTAPEDILASLKLKSLIDNLT